MRLGKITFSFLILAWILSQAARAESGPDPYLIGGANVTCDQTGCYIGKPSEAAAPAPAAPPALSQEQKEALAFIKQLRERSEEL